MTVQALVTQQNLINVNDSLTSIGEELKKVPPFRAVLQDVLLNELQQLLPEVYISKVFINRRRSDIKHPEPTGLLMDVFMECLSRGRPPVYDTVQYGVYDWLDSTDEQDQVEGLDVVALGALIGAVLKTLVQKYTAVLDRYWAAARGTDAKGRALGSRSSGLLDLYAALFWHESGAMVQEGGLSPQVEVSLERFIKGNAQAPAYSVSVELEDGRFATLACCFVMHLNGQFQNELFPGNDHPVILYTSAKGLETFETSAALHRTLQERLVDRAQRAQLLKGVSLDDAEQVRSAPDVRYLNVQGSVFEAFISTLFDKQYSDIATCLRRTQTPDANVQSIFRSLESIQRMDELIQDAKARTARLIKLISKNAWPQWLKNNYLTNQEIYVSLEQELLKSQVTLHGVMGGLSSFQEYVRRVVEGHISLGDENRVDPDSIWVSVKHSVRMGAKTIEHVERKSLTQLFMYGMHDTAGRFEIGFEAFHNNPRLTVSNVEKAIKQFDLRLSYASERNRRYLEPHVKEAMREVLGRQVALSNFAAILQKHISPKAQDIVQRYLFGDPAMEAFGVAFRKYFRPFKDMIVYRAKGATPDRSMHVLYAPGAPTGQEWYEFLDLTALKRQFIKWGYEKGDREYLIGQAFSGNRPEFIKDYLSLDDPRPVFEQWWWDGVSLVQWTSGTENGPLMGAIANIIVWDIAEEKVVTPDWYRKAGAQDRELFTRLNTDLKAIHEVSKEPLNIESFAGFSQNLVMKTLNDYLRRSGAHPEIDPDRVTVKLRGYDWMTLTNLFIQWELWRSDVSTFEKLFPYVVPGGSFLEKLRDISRTATFRSLDNTSLGRLDVSTINGLINLLPGEQYEKYLKLNFLDTPSHDLKAKLYCKAKQNEMLRAALTQKMQGSLSSEHFQWLKGLIEDLDREQRLNTGLFWNANPPGKGVSELVLEGKRIEGAYVFGREVAGKFEYLIYIPKAPDGLAFRTIGTLTQGLKSYALGEHVVGLAKLKDRGVIQRYVDACRETANGSALPAPMLRGSAPVSHFNSEYDRMVWRLIQDVDYQTTSAGEAFWRDVAVITELVVDVVSLFVPPVGLVASVLKITRSIVQGLIAYSEGDERSANAHFASAWRSAITFYAGKIAGAGVSVSAVGFLSRVKDISEIVSTVTGVPMGIEYVTAVTSAYSIPDSETRITG
jgi:hypothetical protein